MADKLIRNFTNTATSPAADDYLALDGTTNNTRKMLASALQTVDGGAEAFGTKLVSPSLYLDGSNDYLEVADSDKLSFTDGTDDLPFSISMWLKISDATTFAAVSKYGTSAANQEWAVRTSGGDTLNFQTSDTAGNVSTLVSNSSITSYEGQWIHLCITYPGAGPNSGNAFTANMDGAIAYLNGEVLATTASNNASYTGMSNTSQAVWIGRWASSYAEGHLKEVKLYNRELSAVEVVDSMNGDLGFADAYGGDESTSGTLVVGKRYRLLDYIAGDDFTNVGAASNADFVEFIATGTTPTTWTNSSVVEAIGTPMDMRAVNYDADTDKLYDLSTNNFIGVNNGATLVGRPYPVYETGTWTPSLTFGGGSTGMTFSTQVGNYTRVGNIVYFRGAFNLTAKGSSTGVAKITGLTHTSIGGTSIGSVGFGLTAGASALTSPISGQVDGNDTTISLYDWGATGTATLSESNFTDTTYTRFSGTYQIQ